MVFFTCNACGESLKKAQIQKHTSICRGCQVLSCIDCGKDFWGEDYKSHVKCISEDQKYGGKNFEAKANKGDVKQQQWIQRVQAALDKPGVSAKLSSVLEQVATYDNVPRKKAKFQNWMKNSLKIYDSSLQDQVWEIFSSESPASGAQEPVHVSPPAPPAQDPQEDQTQAVEKKKNKRERKEERQKKTKKKRNEEEQNGKSKPRKKKRKCDEDEDSTEEEKSTKVKKRKEESEESQDMEESKEEEDEKEAQEESNTKGKFNWKGTIKAVLRQAPEEGIALKKLRKKVLSAYYSFSAEANHKSEEELYSLFNKKLKNPKFRILKEKVRLVK
ncbi:Cell growth-regulating nucleolar protein [Bagarius yarrelli]|uniref:Cell growth-regulating nucleolar protein n=1 Tax=Bagarius yarrelli TaxID=175774 RepID=A0A556TVM2_BAGYA|nr:Cell growth-regulating nucleolar protein [Bagarius yarrelli]